MVGDPRRSTVTAQPSDPYARVTIRPDNGNDRIVLVTVTSEDGSQVRDYTVEFVPR